MTEPLQINSLRHLSALLGVDHKCLLDIASRAPSLYAPFQSQRRKRPFQRQPPQGTPRQIDNPTPALKRVQQKIHRKLLAAVPLPANILGGVSGKSVADNARLHAGKYEVVTMDVHRYFPSITSAQVFNAWRRLGCGTQVARILTQLTTREGHLPQGAPTSTTLANLIQSLTFLPVVNEAARRKGLTVSTWVDDIAVSGSGSRQLITPIASELSRHGFRVSRRKTAIRKRGQRQEITGLLLVGDRLSVSRTRLARIRAGIHKLSESQVPVEEWAGYLRSLQGSIAFVARVDPLRGARLERRLHLALSAASPGDCTRAV